MEAWPGSRWELCEPPQDVDATALSRAIELHLRRGTVGVHNMRQYLGKILADQPYPDILGPVRDAAGASGVCVLRGQLIAQWGDPTAVEMSFSVTKSYLSLLAGIASKDGLIRDVNESVAGRVTHPAFEGSAHASITWKHLLQQTSEWGGSLWGLPWWADPQGGQHAGARLSAAGTTWAYNDVRINLLALALTDLFKAPLSQVFGERVMALIDGSVTWQWHGYRNSFISIEGQPVQCVSGGAHWGGGLWANAYDHARVGLLYLRGGRWKGRTVIHQEWVQQSWAPCAIKPDYGLLWWRNDLRTVFPQAPATGRCARGNLGRQLLWVDPARDLVVVSRWSDGVGDFLAEVASAIPERS